MALIKCPECGHEISDKAKMCPHCGYELPSAQENTVSQEVPTAAQSPQPIAAPAPSAQQTPTSTHALSEQPIKLIDAWKANYPQKAKQGQIAYVFLTAFGVIITLAPIFLLLLHLQNIILPLDDKTLAQLNPFELLSYFSKCKNFIDAVSIGGMVCTGIVSIGLSIFSIWQTMSIASWLKKGMFNVANYWNREDFKWANSESNGNWAAYCTLSPNGKAMFGLNTASAAVLVIGIFCSAYGYFRAEATNKLNNIITGLEPAFPWEPIVAGGVVVLIGIICSVISLGLQKKFLKNYTGQNTQNQ